MLKIKDKERTTILNALRAGVVPSIGLKYIQVGRSKEISEMVKDLIHIENGGSTIRFVVGDFGAGKSFFLTLCKLMAHEKKVLVVQADITTERILCSADGKTRSLITELFKNMSCRSRPEGNSLRFLIETWISNFLEKNDNPTLNDFQVALQPLANLSLSQDFSKILYTYLVAHRNNDTQKIELCLKWIRAEYETKSAAKEDLNINRIVEDSDFSDLLKLVGGFAKLAGFSGFLVLIDELAVLVRQRAPQRHKNYETLLVIINDCLQGNVEGLGFIFGATAEAIENKEKGLYSYGALETRLSENKFMKAGAKDLTGPVMRLDILSNEEMIVLLHKLREIQSNFSPESELIDDEGINAFFGHITSRMGADSFLSPRDIIKDYLSLLAAIESSGKNWKDLLPGANATATPSTSKLVKLTAN